MDKAKGRILLVEPDIYWQALIGEPLEEAGYKVGLAKTRFRAEEMLQAGGFDVVLVELALPDGKGEVDLEEGLRLVRSIKERAYTKIIAVSKKWTDSPFDMPCVYTGKVAGVVVVSYIPTERCGIECQGYIYDYIEKTPDVVRLVETVDELMALVIG